MERAGVSPSMLKSRVHINVSGLLFETREETLQQYRGTLLGNPHKRNKFLSPKTNQYFFNRHKIAFESILFFYQSGKLYRPPDVNLGVFEAECKFFELPEANIVAMRTKEGAVLKDSIKEQLEREKVGNTSFSRRVWNYLENPESSVHARNFALVSLLLVFTSIFTGALETVEELKVEKDDTLTNPWHILEISLNTFFTLELVMRGITAPDKKRFFFNGLNIIDTLVVLSFFIIVFASTNGHTESFPKFMRVLRILRIFRMFHLSKYSPRMRAIGFIVKDSLKDLQLFFVCLTIIVTFAGSIMYCIEQTDNDTQFTSIPQSMWWAVQTFLTLGYGDIVPTTVIGKLFSSMYMVFGVATISLPVLSLIMKFTTYYTLQCDN